MPGTCEYDPKEAENQNNSGDFPLIPDGTYVFQITGVVEQTSSNKDPMINTTFQGTEAGMEKLKLWDRIVFPRPNSKARSILGRSIHFLHCIGEPYDSPITWDERNWAWRKVKIQVGTRTYNSKPQNYVAKYILDEELNPTLNEESPRLPF